MRQLSLMAGWVSLQKSMALVWDLEVRGRASKVKSCRHLFNSKKECTKCVPNRKHWWGTTFQGVTIDEAKKIVKMIGANALVVHLNPLQELIQPEGELLIRSSWTDFRPCQTIDIPLIVKEVGAGISKEVAIKLEMANVARSISPVLAALVGRVLKSYGQSSSKTTSEAPW